MKRAIIVGNDNGICEVRCANCGKLLFTFCKNQTKIKRSVDKTAQFVIIVSRCTRNSCKMDNEIQLSL
jgi:hypothetical protein